MKKNFVLVACLLFSLLSSAQPGGGGDPGGGEPVPLPAIGILVAAGALLGVRAMLRKKAEH